MKANFQFTITYESIVDTDTGEILETRIVSKTDMAEAKKPVKKAKKEEDPNPKITLDSNKYSMNTAAMGLMGIAPDDKLEISYETKDGISYPVIQVNLNTGNRLTKSGTVALRGAKNEALSKYGTEFDLVKHPTEDGVFILKSDKVVDIPKGDNNVKLDEDDEVPFDLNLDELVDTKDVNETEIDSSFFKF